MTTAIAILALLLAGFACFLAYKAMKRKLPKPPDPRVAGYINKSDLLREIKGHVTLQEVADYLDKHYLTAEDAREEFAPKGDLSSLVQLLHEAVDKAIAAKKLVTQAELKRRLDNQASAPPPSLGQTVQGFPPAPPTKADGRRGQLGTDDLLREIEALDVPALRERVSNAESNASRALSALRRAHRFLSTLKEVGIDPHRVELDQELEKLEAEFAEGHLALKTVADDAEGEYVALCAHPMKDEPSDADLRYEAERHIGSLRQEYPSRSFSYDEELELKRQYVQERARHKAEHDRKLRLADEKAKRGRRALQDFEASTDVLTKKERVKGIKAGLASFEALDRQLEELYQAVEPGGSSIAPKPPKPEKMTSRRPIRSGGTATRTPTMRPSAQPPDDPHMAVEDEELMNGEEEPEPDSVEASLKELASFAPPPNKRDSQ